jgi:hypothetical protein
MSQENINILNDSNNLLPLSNEVISILKPNAIKNTLSKEDKIKNESFFNRDKLQIPLSKLATEEELRKIISNQDRNKTDKDNNPSKKQKN